MISLIIPVFNEQEAIEETVTKAYEVFSGIGELFEILVINDGSTDRTTAILSGLRFPDIHVITHPRNVGYGASMKTGLRRAKGELIAIIDADGTYPIADFPQLLQTLRTRNADMVIGARTKKGAQIPWIRKPAKAIVAMLANMLTGMNIPDNNSGMRIFTKSMAEEFMHLFPQKFSFTLTLTLAALTSDYIVEFVPIDYFKRKGKSSLSSGFNGIKNFAGFLSLIVRITTYFRPLRFFAIPSLLLIVIGVLLAFRSLVVERNISDSEILMLLTGLQIGLFGLLAEVIVRQGRAKR